MTNAIISSMKTCFKCGVSQPRTEFYKHSAMGDGLLGKCKTCAKNDVHIHRAKNIEKIRAYDKERSKNPERIKLALEINRRWRNEDKRRSKAHNLVARAIRRGELVKQCCCVCGDDNSLAHHESYDRPLEVVWYCQVHHKDRHKQMVLQGIES